MPVDGARLERRYARDPGFVFRRVADEVILLPIRRNMGDLESIFTLNEVGARVWELLDGRRSLREVRDAVVGEFEVTADTAADDLLDFVERLEAVGAVTGPSG
jgi:hypothetical protein